MGRSIEQKCWKEFTATSVLQNLLLRSKLKKCVLGKKCRIRSQNYSTLTSKKKSTGNLEIYCCSFPFLTIVFSDIPLYLTAFLAGWTKTSLFLFSPISWLIHISCSSISLRGLIAEKIYLYWGLFYNTRLQKLPYNSSFCNIYITSNIASFSLSRDLKNWNWWSPEPPVFICPSSLGLIFPGETCHHICPRLKNN